MLPSPKIQNVQAGLINLVNLEAEVLAEEGPLVILSG